MGALNNTVNIEEYQIGNLEVQTKKISQNVEQNIKEKKLVDRSRRFSIHQIGDLEAVMTDSGRGRHGNSQRCNKRKFPWVEETCTDFKIEKPH